MSGKVDNLDKRGSVYVAVKAAAKTLKLDPAKLVEEIPAQVFREDYAGAKKAEKVDPSVPFAEVFASLISNEIQRRAGHKSKVKA